MAIDWFSFALGAGSVFVVAVVVMGWYLSAIFSGWK